jgi:hypothetical protein
MHRHTTHWSVVGALHLGAVKDCPECAVQHLAGLAHTGLRDDSGAVGHHRCDHSA